MATIRQPRAVEGAVDSAQRMLRKLGVEVARTRWGVPYRRVEILRHLGVDLLLDVGANEGQYVTELRGTGWDGRVVSYEPGSDAFRALRRRCDHDPHWSPVQTAVGDHDGSLELNISEESRFSSPLPVLDETVSRSRTFRYARRETVPVRRLDDLAGGLPSDRLALKIDVQGF